MGFGVGLITLHHKRHVYYEMLHEVRPGQSKKKLNVDKRQV